MCSSFTVPPVLRRCYVPMADASERDNARAAASEPPAALFKKPKQRNKHVRARPSDDADVSAAAAGASDVAESAVVRPVKVAKANPLVQSTSTSTTSSLQKEFAHASDVRISAYDNKATASSEQDTAHSQDAQAQYEAAQKMWEDGGDVAADGTKIYRGAKAYRQYTGKAESFDRQVSGGHGPARAPVHYRATARFDYQPDICKDYKDTGFCGYGDACKFLHDRSDYKTGWQLERQWDEEQKAKAHALALAAFEESEKAGSGAAGGSAGGSGNSSLKDDGLPFACLICREPWHAQSHPVVTKCEHYFCERCALQHASRTKRCHVCAENTGGIFNKATAIQEKIDQMTRFAQVQAAGQQTDEQILAEYEAEKRGKSREHAGGWALV